jgi:Domain of unknown function (DUF4436)
MPILNLPPRKLKPSWQSRYLALCDSLRDGKAERGWLGVWLGIFLTLLLLVVLLLIGSAASPAQTKADSNNMRVSLSVLGVDPLRGELETRLEFDPLQKGRLKPGALPSQDLIFYVNSVDKQGSEVKFSAGRSMDAIAARFTLFSGNSEYYPFDRYLAEVSFEMEINNQAHKDVPIDVIYTERIPGFKLEFASQNGGKDAIGVDYEVKIRRSLPVLLFACSIMLMMWIVSLLAVLMALMYWRIGHIPDLGVIGLMTSLLFAFPAIRNSQPGVPPVGTLGDFLSFFWAESLVIIALAITWISFLRRYSKPKP